MRIVAGSLRGRLVDAPDGMDTRPTTDRVREALFSSLYSLRGGFEGAVVLDAFAGSGALGIEALSRGAQRAVFCELGDKAHAVLRRNVEGCKLGSAQATVLRRDVLKQPPAAALGVFDLVFLDPPYSYDAGEVLAMVRGMAEAGSLAPEAIVVYEHGQDAKNRVAEAAESCGFTVRAQKKYGKTAVTTLIA